LNLGEEYYGRISNYILGSIRGGRHKGGGVDERTDEGHKGIGMRVTSPERPYRQATHGQLQETQRYQALPESEEGKGHPGQRATRMTGGRAEAKRL